MSQFFVASMNGGSGAVTSVTGTNGLTASPTTGAVVVSGVNATTSTVGVASFNPTQFTVTVGGQVSLIDNVIVGTVTTVDATPGVLNVNIPVPASSIVSIRVNIAGYDVPNQVGCALELLGGMKNVAGSLTVVGNTDVTKNCDATLINVQASIVASGTNAQIQLTGVLGHTINWRGLIEVVGAP